MNLQSTFALKNGTEMPILGLGAFRSLEDEGREAIVYALSHGYRLVDTASMYGNEALVGEAVRQSGLAREQVFLTSKLWKDDMDYEKAMVAFERTLAALGVDYLDLYLIHWPVEGLIEETWRALEELYAQKRIRAIGVSNFSVRLLREMQKTAAVMPMVNQVQLHPLCTQEELLQWCAENGVFVQAWSPLARGAVFEMEPIRAAAERHGKTPAQVTLRWVLQKGAGAIPKSVHPARIVQNADVFDFCLDEAEMKAISALNQNKDVTRSGVPKGALAE